MESATANSTRQRLEREHREECGAARMKSVRAGVELPDPTEP